MFCVIDILKKTTYIWISEEKFAHFLRNKKKKEKPIKFLTQMNNFSLFNNKLGSIKVLS